MKQEHKLEALCVDGSVISFDQIVAMRGRIVRHGSWHYLQVDGEPERAVVLRPTLRESLRMMGDYARRKKREARDASTYRQLAVYARAAGLTPTEACTCRCPEPDRPAKLGFSRHLNDCKYEVAELVAPKLTPTAAKIVRKLHPDLYELPQLDNMRGMDGDPESYVMV